jgi:hypothetical protein
MLIKPNPFESLGHVFLSSFTLFRKTWKRLFPLTIFLSIAVLSPSFLLYNPQIPILFLGYFVFSLFVFACVVYYTVLEERGNRPLLKDVLYVVIKKMLVILVAVISAMVLILLGYGLIIIPGIIATVWFSMCLPLILLENAGPFDVLRKSYELTTDHWARTAVVIFVPVIFVSLIGVVIWQMFRLNIIAVMHYRILLNVFIFLSSVFYLPWVAALIALQFEDLKKRQVAEVLVPPPHNLAKPGEAKLNVRS